MDECSKVSSYLLFAYDLSIYNLIKKGSKLQLLLFFPNIRKWAEFVAVGRVLQNFQITQSNNSLYINSKVNRQDRICSI